MVEIAYIVVAVLVLIASAYAFIARIRVFFGYYRANKTTTASGENAEDVARRLLDDNGMNDVEVKKCGFIRAMIFGNHYRHPKKTIYLRRAIYGRSTLTAVGIAVQKVGIAKLHYESDVKAIARSKMQTIAVFAPIFFLPIVLVGTLLDIVFFNASGVCTIVFTVLGILYFIAGFVFTFLNIPVEKRANEEAMRMLEENGILDAEERAHIEKVLKTYIVMYVADFVVAVLKIVELVLRILMIASRRD